MKYEQNSGNEQQPANQVKQIVRRYLVLQLGNTVERNGTETKITPLCLLRYVDAKSKEEAIGIFYEITKNEFNNDNDYKSKIDCYEIEKIQILSA